MSGFGTGAASFRLVRTVKHIDDHEANDAQGVSRSIWRGNSPGTERPFRIRFTKSRLGRGD